MAYLVAIIFLIHSINYFFMNSLPEVYKWFLWDCTLIASALLSSILFYMALPHRKRKLKIASVIIVIINAWLLVDYTIVWILDENAYSEALRYVFTVMLFGLLVSFGIYAAYKICSAKSDEYNKKDSFIVHRAPKNFIGLVGSIFKNPEGLTFIVARGQEYRFSHGKVVSKKHNTSQYYTYRCVHDINDRDLDPISNLKWSFKNNCFTVFKRYDRKPRSA